MATETVAETQAAEHRQGEEALTSVGQRKINLLWEMTQALIALGSVYTVLYLSAAGEEIPPVIENMVFLIIGAYFSRTNHEKIGGVGAKPRQVYEGR